MIEQIVMIIILQDWLKTPSDHYIHYVYHAHVQGVKDYHISGSWDIVSCKYVHSFL